MTDSTTFVRRKIQLLIDSDVKLDREKFYEKLFSWRDIAYKGANLIMSHLYIQEKLQDMIYLDEGVKVRLADRKKEETGILNCSKMNTGYKLLSKLFAKQIPMNIAACINQMALKNYNLNRSEYWYGRRSVSNYKRTMPIPFSSYVISLKMDESNFEYKFKLFKIPFRTYLGRDRTDKRELLKKVTLGYIKLCQSAIQIESGKIYLLITVEMPKRQTNLDTLKIAEATLGFENPIIVNSNKKSLQIGSKEEFLYQRLSIQAARKRLQRSSSFNRGGKGRNKKLKAIERFSKREHNYIDNKLHLYSRQLIDFCLTNNCGNLLLVNQSQQAEIAKQDITIIRNWGYSGLVDKIMYKAQAANINVIIE